MSRAHEEHETMKQQPGTLYLTGTYVWSLGLKATGLTTPEYSADGRTFQTFAYIVWHAALQADGVNGGVNETGLRRYRRLLAWAAEHGVPVVWAGTYSNAYASQADLEAALAR
jgi:hypothetical protein